MKKSKSNTSKEFRNSLISLENNSSFVQLGNGELKRKRNKSSYRDLYLEKKNFESIEIPLSIRREPQYTNSYHNQALNIRIDSIKNKVDYLNNSSLSDSHKITLSKKTSYSNIINPDIKNGKKNYNSSSKIKQVNKNRNLIIITEEGRTRNKDNNMNIKKLKEKKENKIEQIKINFDIKNSEKEKYNSYRNIHSYTYPNEKLDIALKEKNINGNLDDNSNQLEQTNNDKIEDRFYIEENVTIKDNYKQKLNNEDKNCLINKNIGNEKILNIKEENEIKNEKNSKRGEHINKNVTNTSNKFKQKVKKIEIIKNKEGENEIIKQNINKIKNIDEKVNENKKRNNENNCKSEGQNEIINEFNGVQGNEENVKDNDKDENNGKMDYHIGQKNNNTNSFQEVNGEINNVTKIGDNKGIKEDKIINRDNKMGTIINKYKNDKINNLRNTKEIEGDIKNENKCLNDLELLLSNFDEETPIEETLEKIGNILLKSGDKIQYENLDKFENKSSNSYKIKLINDYIENNLKLFEDTFVETQLKRIIKSYNSKKGNEILLKSFNNGENQLNPNYQSKENEKPLNMWNDSKKEDKSAKIINQSRKEEKLLNEKKENKKEEKIFKIIDEYKKEGIDVNILLKNMKKEEEIFEIMEKGNLDTVNIENSIKLKVNNNNYGILDSKNNIDNKNENFQNKLQTNDETFGSKEEINSKKENQKQNIIKNSKIELKEDNKSISQKEENQSIDDSKELLSDKDNLFEISSSENGYENKPEIILTSSEEENDTIKTKSNNNELLISGSSLSIANNNLKESTEFRFSIVLNDENQEETSKEGIKYINDTSESNQSGKENEKNKKEETQTNKNYFYEDEKDKTYRYKDYFEKIEEIKEVDENREESLLSIKNIIDKNDNQNGNDKLYLENENVNSNKSFKLENKNLHEENYANINKNYSLDLVSFKDDKNNQNNNSTFEKDDILLIGSLQNSQNINLLEYKNTNNLKCNFKINNDLNNNVNNITENTNCKLTENNNIKFTDNNKKDNDSNENMENEKLDFFNDSKINQFNSCEEANLNENINQKIKKISLKDDLQENPKSKDNNPYVKRDIVRNINENEYDTNMDVKNIVKSNGNINYISNNNENLRQNNKNNYNNLNGNNNISLFNNIEKNLSKIKSNVINKTTLSDIEKLKEIQKNLTKSNLSKKEIINNNIEPNLIGNNSDKSINLCLNNSKTINKNKIKTNDYQFQNFSISIINNNTQNNINKRKEGNEQKLKIVRPVEYITECKIEKKKSSLNNFSLPSLNLLIHDEESINNLEQHQPLKKKEENNLSVLSNKYEFSSKEDSFKLNLEYPKLESYKLRYKSPIKKILPSIPSINNENQIEKSFKNEEIDLNKEIDKLKNYSLKKKNIELELNNSKKEEKNNLELNSKNKNYIELLANFPIEKPNGFVNNNQNDIVNEEVYNNIKKRILYSRNSESEILSVKNDINKFLYLLKLKNKANDSTYSDIINQKENEMKYLREKAEKLSKEKTLHKKFIDLNLNNNEDEIKVRNLNNKNANINFYQKIEEEAQMNENNVVIPASTRTLRKNYIDYNLIVKNSKINDNQDKNEDNSYLVEKYENLKKKNYVSIFDEKNENNYYIKQTDKFIRNKNIKSNERESIGFNDLSELSLGSQKKDIYNPGPDINSLLQRNENDKDFYNLNKYQNLKKFYEDEKKKKDNCLKNEPKKIKDNKINYLNKVKEDVKILSLQKENRRKNLDINNKSNNIKENSNIKLYSNSNIDLNILPANTLEYINEDINHFHLFGNK